MKIIKIYLDDLTPEKQEEILEALDGDDGNYDVFPIVTLELRIKRLIIKLFVFLYKTRRFYAIPRASINKARQNVTESLRCWRADS